MSYIVAVNKALLVVIKHLWPFISTTKAYSSISAMIYLLGILYTSFSPLFVDIPVIPDLEDSVEDTSNQIAIAPR